MKKIIFILVVSTLFIATINPYSAYSAGEKSGYILLQVEKNGEAWYVYPGNGNKYFLGRPADAFAVMKKLALGAKHDFIANTDIFPVRLSGSILLDTERNGEAYYIYPKDNKKYFLGNPGDAFRIMRGLGQGISNSGLINIPVGDISSSIPNISSEKIMQDIPFTPQAPFGQWSDMRQQDGCEEASSLMAVKWAKGQSLTKQDALNQILGSSDFTLKKYGEYRDISTTDTLNWIIKDYFNYKNASRKTNIQITDIINELEKGNIIITPMNGQLLHNPYYTQPGPIHHMLVIIGYDPGKKAFITNDPGTKRGEHYEYDINVLFNAVRDYHTGYNESNKTVEKNMIVVWK
jgi:hypothetical protein